MLKVNKVYSTRSKADNYLNANTNKVMESATVKVDEYTKFHGDEKRQEEPENYRTFIYYYQGMLIDKKENINVGLQESVTID